jgi:hypothetical protein
MASGQEIPTTGAMDKVFDIKLRRTVLYFRQSKPLAKDL